MQIFISTLRQAINSEGDDVPGAGADQGAMKQAIDSLAATFSELQEVLDMPMMQYASLNTFLVRMLGRKPLAARLTQSRNSLVDVCS